MRLFNADGGRAEVSGNGVRGLAALLLQGDRRDEGTLTDRDRRGHQAVDPHGL